MISTSEAISLVNRSTPTLGSTTKPIRDCLGYILHSSAKAEINLPPFNQSAMDGYAIKLGDTDKYKVIGEIQAGDDASSILLNPGEAIKIFTGAMCPDHADLICRIEDIHEDNDFINILIQPKTGANIRLKGEQIRANEIALNTGAEINPAAIGFLANLGVSKINVVRQPVINVVSTGNELVPPNSSSTLSPGQIFESNGIMLQSVVNQRGFHCSSTAHLVDDYKSVLNGLKSKLDASDVLIISGGISVGDYDFVGKALLELGVKEIFYKVNQKPGKPLFFGTKGSKLIFALPGNPAAALTCFYVYILPALNKLSGKGFIELPRIKVPTQSPIDKSNSREQFLKAKLDNEKAEILEGQSSAMLRTFADANALAHIPANTTFERGNIIDLILL